MKLRILLGVTSLSLGSLVLAPAALGQEKAGEHGEQRGGGQKGAAAERSKAAPSRAAPKFQAHPPGKRPKGPVVRQHQVRVLQPRVVERGHEEWRHWRHPNFSRPVYYWDWGAVRSVTCTAEDSYGDQYPVTEEVSNGFGADDMTGVEDNALDRCYQESGQDPSCYLATCVHY